VSDICCDGFDGVDGADVCVVIDDCCGGGWGGRTDVGACVMSGEGSMAGRTAGCCREDGPFSVKVLGDTSGQLDELYSTNGECISVLLDVLLLGMLLFVLFEMLLIFVLLFEDVVV